MACHPCYQLWCHVFTLIQTYMFVLFRNRKERAKQITIMHACMKWLVILRGNNKISYAAPLPNGLKEIPNICSKLLLLQGARTETKYGPSYWNFICLYYTQKLYTCDKKRLVTAYFIIFTTISGTILCNWYERSGPAEPTKWPLIISLFWAFLSEGG